jgi:phage tail-like protein
MARSEALDRLHIFRFALRDAGDPVVGGDVFDAGGNGATGGAGLGGAVAGIVTGGLSSLAGSSNGLESGIGFASIGGGEMRAEPVEIKEGTWPFAHYVVERASMAPIVLRRGILPVDSDFYNWFIACLFGYQFTRRNLILSLLDRHHQPARSWLLHNCIPIRCSPWPELDAARSDIALAELEIQPEYVEEFN